MIAVSEGGGGRGIDSVMASLSSPACGGPSSSGTSRSQSARRSWSSNAPGSVPVRGAPHRPQNRSSASNGAPHEGQNPGPAGSAARPAPRSAPHLAQNRSSARVGEPQDAQVVITRRGYPWSGRPPRKVSESSSTPARPCSCNSMRYGYAGMMAGQAGGDGLGFGLLLGAV